MTKIFAALVAAILAIFGARYTGDIPITLDPGGWEAPTPPEDPTYPPAATPEDRPEPEATQAFCGPGTQPVCLGESDDGSCWASTCEVVEPPTPKLPCPDGGWLWWLHCP